MIYRTAPFSMSLNPTPSFKVTPFFDAEYLRNGTTYRHSFNEVLIGTYTCPTQRRRLRSATTQKLLVRRTRLRTIGDRAFGAIAPRVWNDLPADIVSAPSLAIFKQRLKTHLFGQSFG